MISAQLTNWLLRNRPFLAFIPVCMGLTIWSVAYMGMAMHVCLAWAALGLFLWTLMEWLLHRGMHTPTRLTWITRVQDVAHFRHHREPNDLEHSVVRLSASVPISLLLLGGLRLLLGNWPRAAAVLSGILTGYLLYEAVHLMSHAPRKGRLPAFLRKYHQSHHFGDWNRSFGVTSPIWDWVFGTLPTGGGRSGGRRDRSPGTGRQDENRVRASGGGKPSL